MIRTPISPRTFAYCRGSTSDQTTDNQVEEIKAAGFAVESQRIITETVSGSVAASERKGFAKLLDKLEAGDVLIVTKLDRLGRNAIDVRATVERLESSGVRVHCLALGGVDLTSPAGKMTMQVMNAIAEFERDLLIERTNAGISRAKADGKVFGRPSALTPSQQSEVASHPCCRSSRSPDRRQRVQHQQANNHARTGQPTHRHPVRPRRTLQRTPNWRFRCMNALSQQQVEYDSVVL